MTNTFDNNNDTHQQVLLETAKISWQELQYFFAKGMAIYVSADLDLIDVATQFAKDNKISVEQWMEAGKIAKVSTEQAKQWHASDALVWAVVIKPWVLVQESQPKTRDSSNIN